eukprot:c9008_g1_i1.p1 GENE.c9008_g1_i1~~c9008_g1_i1.p1  ORF type:complete len:447 (+),score=47.78 c9008_g1_i1:51-1391(+)
MEGERERDKLRVWRKPNPSRLSLKSTKGTTATVYTVDGEIVSLSIPRKGIRRKLVNATWNFTNLVISSPLVALPYTLVQAGPLLGLIFLLMNATLGGYTSLKLAQSGTRVQCLSYEELVRFCFGNFGYYFALALIFMCAFGVMIARVVLIGDMMGPIHRHYLPFANRVVAVLVSTTLVALPLSLFRHITDLRLASLMSLLANLIIVGLLISESVNQNKSYTWKDMSVVGDQPFIAFGTICFLFANQEFTFPMYKATGSTRPKHWIILTVTSMLIAFVVAGSMAISGFLAFGLNLHSDVLENFSDANPVANLARGMECFIVLSGFPLDVYICRHAIIRMCGFEAATVSLPYHVTITLILFFVSVLPGAFITDLGLVQSITGSIAGVLIGFIVPSLCVLRVNKLLTGSYLESWADAFLLGVFSFGVMAMIRASISFAHYGEPGESGML